MLLEDAIPKLRDVIGMNFSDLYQTEELQGIRVAKGNAGKLLEKILGLPPGNSLRDFDDGELKTNKSGPDGLPLETMFISQLSIRFDDFIRGMSYEDSWINRKISNLIYVPVCKQSEEPENWYFHSAYHIPIASDPALLQKLSADFSGIQSLVRDQLESGDRMLHTASGELIQIRTKDSKPYHPIYSSTLERNVSDKNYAFYFKKPFMRLIQANYQAI